LKSTCRQLSSIDRVQAGSLPDSRQATADRLPRHRGNSPSFSDSAEIWTWYGQPRWPLPPVSDLRRRKTLDPGDDDLGGTIDTFQQHVSFC